MAYTELRIFCATPPQLEPERRVFYNIVEQWNRASAISRGELLVPLSLLPRIADLRPFDSVIRENIRQSRYYIHVFTSDSARDFLPYLEEALHARGGGALHEVVVFSKDPAAPAPAGVRRFEYRDLEDFRALLCALFQEWLDRPAWFLRPAMPQDEPFLLELLRAATAEQLHSCAWDENLREPLLRMQVDARRAGYRREYPDASQSVVVVEGCPAGYLVVARSHDCIRLVDIAIAARYRGRGIATRLIGSLLEEGDRSAKPVRLQVARHSPALRLYQRLGFVATADNEVVLEMERAPRRV